MLRTNLELVQSAFDAYFRGDEPALLQLVAADVVITQFPQRGRGRVSGAPVESEIAFVFTARDGLIARWQMFSSEERALEAAGLEG